MNRLTGAHHDFDKIVEQIRRVADSPLTVLIEGETGTGKEVAARTIHRLSGRRSGAFVAVDCGAIPETLIESELFGHERGAFTGADQRREGRFRTAGNGTLFLDEIANMPFSTQAKLLRVLQERQVHPLGSARAVPIEARVIAASNFPLDREIQSGRFRQDLYYRLNEFVIRLPPLHARDDIQRLANEFAAEASQEFGGRGREISEAAARILQRYSWPGNVRELRSVIRRAVLLCEDVIEPEHLSFLAAGVAPSPLGAGSGDLPRSTLRGSALPGSSLKEIAVTAAADAEQRAICHTLRLTKGNRSEAARLLRTDYKTLYLKIKQYRIDAGRFRDSATSPFVPADAALRIPS